MGTKRFPLFIDLADVLVGGGDDHQPFASLAQSDSQRRRHRAEGGNAGDQLRLTAHGLHPAVGVEIRRVDGGVPQGNKRHGFPLVQQRGDLAGVFLVGRLQPRRVPGQVEAQNKIPPVIIRDS
mgnify:CR=1 FL=1